MPLDVVVEYALGSNWALSSAAFAAFSARPDRQAALDATLSRLPNVGAWPLHFALTFVDGLGQRPAPGELLVRIHEHSVQHPLIAQLFTASFKRREALRDAPTFGAGLRHDAPPSDGLEPLLTKIDHPFARALQRELADWKSRRIDREFLAQIGRFWEDIDPLLVEYEALREPVATVVTAITHVPPRSVVIVGEPRVGKNALARLAGEQLRARGYQIFEASGADLMAGQKWFGQLEGRLHRTVAELAAAKKLIWYVPDILQIPLSGTHSGQAASILDQILPAVDAGRLIVWTEATAAARRGLLQLRPALRSVLEVGAAGACIAEETRALAAACGACRARASPRFDPECVPSRAQLARQYLSVQLPGSVLDLIKLTANRVSSRTSES